MPRYYLSPSRVARYYFHECDRYLRYAATPRAARAEEGIPATELDRTLVTTAILESGYAWETHVVTAYLADTAVIASGDEAAPLHERRHTVESTMEALRNAKVGTAIYQPTLRAPAGFYEAYGLDQDLVEFVECHPDLLIVVDEGDGPEVRVVDVKASDLMKLAHRIQVALYSIILQHVLSGDDLDARLRSSSKGGVWLFEQEKPEWFDLVYVRPPLETFLSHDLQPLLRAPAPDAFWHLYFRCEWCDYYSHCRGEAEKTDDVSLVPYLSTFAKRHLAERAGVRTVKEFGELLERADVEEILKGSASLEGRSRQLALTVKALQTGTEIPTGASSIGMPVGEHVRVLLTIQSDPLSGSMYAYALNRIAGADIFGSKTETIARVSPSGGADDLAAIRRALVTDLMGLFRPLHDFNTAHADEWKAQKTVQTYVFDGYERTLLVQVLLEAILDPASAEDALALLFYFQHPDLVAAENHPASEVFFPVIVLTEVIRSLFAMPVAVAYRFADVVKALEPSQYAFDYKHDDFWCFELSNRLKANAILSVWNNGRADLLPNIEAELRRRVWAAGSVVNGIRERLKGTDRLFAWPPKFSLPEGLDFDDPLLSRLAFIARYEVVLDYLDTRTRRAAAEEDRLTRGDSIKLRALGGDLFQRDERHADLEITTTDFWNHIFTVDRPSGRRARLAYDDFRFRQAQWAPKNYDLALARIRDVQDDGRIKLELKGGQAFGGHDEGDVCCLEPRFTDANSPRIVGELAALDKTPNSRFAQLIRDPVAARGPTGIDPSLRAHALKLADRHGMTRSQRAAFEGILDQDLQLVWGPPGTGKTHFLSLAILCLLEAHRRAGQRLHVLISAFTHTAIDNCLTKLEGLQQAQKVVGGNFALRKIVAYGSAPIDTVHPTEAAAFARDTNLCVLGATVWQAQKIAPDDLSYDLVVIDEGSQLDVAESAIPIRRLKSRGRLLIAGDDRQLPPIVHGDYPVVEGEPLLHRSILECLRALDPQDVVVRPLLENFRMCDVLCEYPASSIYPADYAPFNDQIAARRLPINIDGSRLVDLGLDPAFPVAMFISENVSATAENQLEAGLVADLTFALRDWLPEGSDEEFWQERLFVVSPHHAQIRAIRRALATRAWDAEPFVGTVDRMQGQECDAVIVSYGVSDVEFALGEREFIYSLNRLNVAITRARMKTIVFISRALLESPIQALDRDGVAEGIAFMQGLARWCELRNEPLTVRSGDATFSLLRG